MLIPMWNWWFLKWLGSSCGCWIHFYLIKTKQMIYWCTNHCIWAIVIVVLTLANITNNKIFSIILKRSWRHLNNKCSFLFRSFCLFALGSNRVFKETFMNVWFWAASHFDANVFYNTCTFIHQNNPSTIHLTSSNKRQSGMGGMWRVHV